MARRVLDQGEVHPRERVRDDGPDGDGYFYAHEAVEILGLQQIDYRQLRRVFELVRRQAGLPVPTGWARYSLQDLAGVRVALRLAGGSDMSSDPRSRLQLAALERACIALHDSGVDNPLLDLQLERHGRKIFALVEGTMLDPVTGQEALQVSDALTRGYLEGRRIEDDDVRAALSSALTRSSSSDGPRGRGRQEVPVQ